ncbi:unnamed protein product [Zymoseptoria tritici ST99CH_1A5]|uniref:Uncharacterized protein n=3 Tax=Zymoseptoria tritici TaxID=1047171 RepID=A0A1X7S2Z4_ZYMT9|nr:unnamed protein product [Zymoseptoria tritici ST99CH_3D7]SMR58489.1 unnamed protein product [Zymoseptoria tritici ST99CH_1E4]SMR61478.1 unnamed protein product [Zymoseptoria tritici ST99CH_3D1]SMY27689.1 unnamed protein product [Zymoseptoria tritici ST99CH_1A5]
MQPISIILLALSANLALASVLTPPGLEKRLGCIWTNCCGEGIKGRHCLGDYQECPKGTCDCSAGSCCVPGGEC